jgi:hypothetical protein
MTRLDIPAMVRVAQDGGRAVAWLTMPCGTVVAVAAFKPRKVGR